jgi:cell division protein FtsL
VSRKPVIQVVEISKLNEIYQRKDVATAEKMQIEERCGNHEKRICGIEKKLNATLVGVVAILAGVIVELTLTIIRGGIHL